MSVVKLAHYTNETPEQGPQDILNFFQAANNKLVKNKLLKYGIIRENKLAISSQNKSVFFSIFDIPLEPCRNAFRSRLKGRCIGRPSFLERITYM
jgi:hypothetical protein